jgi:CheY-like chemotaxis protein
MSNQPFLDDLPAGTAGSMDADAGADGERSVGEIRDEFGSTVSQLKQKYGQLIEQRDRQIQHLASRLAQGPAKQRKRRVLIVDDAKSTAEIVSHYLAGYPITLAHAAAAAALGAVRAHEYDAIFAEAAAVIEPGVDGLTFCRQLCEGSDRKNVVAMSSRPGDRIRESAEKAGVLFLRKPFQREQLLALLRGMLPKENR